MRKAYAPVTGDEDENLENKRAAPFRADVVKMRMLRCNWMYTMIVTALVCAGYTTPFSTLHQFITYPRENRTETEQPGLGESEIMYAGIIAMYSVGETVAAAGTGIFLRYFSYWSCFMFSVFLHLVGGVMYGLATNGGMMLVSRLLIGAHAGLGWSLAVAYYGERCEEYDQLKLELLFKGEGRRQNRNMEGNDGRNVEGNDGRSMEGNDGRSMEGNDGRSMEGNDGRSMEGNDGRNVEGNDGRSMEGEKESYTELSTSEAMEIMSGGKAKEQNEYTSSEYANATESVVAVKVKHHSTRTKDLLHSLFAISNSLVSGFSVVLVVLIQLIPGVDKFRIVGWLNTVLAAGVMALQLFMFKGEGYCRVKNQKLQCCLRVPWKWVKSHQPGHKIMFLCVLIMVFYTIDSGYNIIDTLSNPILTNQFAFTVEDSGYFFAVATFGFAIGTLMLPVLHRCRVENRYIWIFGMVLAFVGTLILADWQSIGSDPCSDPASFNSSSTCENATLPGYECYWRQRSRVTGKLCLECPPGCISSERTLNFVQFCSAFLLWVTAVPMIRAVTFIITSDQVGKSEQGTVLGICTAAGGLSRAITPLWLNSLYVSTGQHTWAPMMLMLVNLAVIIVSFLLLCGRTTCCWQHSPVHTAGHYTNSVEQHTGTQQKPSVSWSAVNGCHMDPNV